MTTVDRTATLGEIAVTQPAAAALFEHLGMDYCCGGSDTLERACDERGLDFRTVALMLGDEQTEPAPPGAPHPDLAAASITQLCEHILVTHHGPLHVHLQRISALLSTVTRVHGTIHPELYTAQGRFTTIRGELESHVRLEEDALFPACRALDAGAAPAFDPPLLSLLQHAHDELGAALRELRELCGGYDTTSALCATHRALLESLRAFEHGLHQHVHEENNLLFPKVRDRLAAHA
jgi:regulator of cell morphogenesis and NO signaling